MESSFMTGTREKEHNIRDKKMKAHREESIFMVGRYRRRKTGEKNLAGRG